MAETETLSAEDKAYFDTRGETVAAPELEKTEDTTTDEVADTASEEVGDTDDLATEETDGDKPTGQSKVPLAALTKERNERKAAAARAAEAERKAAILEDRWQQLLTSQQQPAKVEPEPEPLDPAKDPLAAVTELWKDTQAQKQARIEAEKTAKETEAANEAWGKTLSTAQTQYQEAAGADADFEPTYKALRIAIGTEFMEAYGLTPQEAKVELDNFEAQQIAFAVSRGINVADHMRKLAKARNVVAAKPEPKTEDLDKLAEGVNGSTSLSNAGGGRVATTSVQSIADMSPSDFEAWLSKNGTDKFRKLAGG